jgi:hypothetical protein
MKITCNSNEDASALFALFIITSSNSSLNEYTITVPENDADQVLLYLDSNWELANPGRKYFPVPAFQIDRKKESINASRGKHWRGSYRYQLTKIRTP